MGRLFGTDGIRGVANVHPMTSEMALNVGRAVTSFFMKPGRPSRIVIGKDTRSSGPMLEHAMAAGICSMGGEALLTGVLPTPGIALLAAATGANAGVVISASHNPFEDNGIKIFNGDGHKLSDEREREIEDLILNDRLAMMCESVRKTGHVQEIEDAPARYVQFLVDTMPRGFSLDEMKIVLDCSNGATFQVAPWIFSELGAVVESLCISPDGTNINKDCGSQQIGRASCRERVCHGV